MSEISQRIEALHRRLAAATDLLDQGIKKMQATIAADTELRDAVTDLLDNAQIGDRGPDGSYPIDAETTARIERVRKALG